MFKFSKEVETIIRHIAVCAQGCGVNIYFVGGMVRDILMDINLKDIDILVEGSAIDFVQKLSQYSHNGLKIKINSIHKDFDTAKITIKGTDIDFASTREETYPFSGCLPVVKNIGCPIDIDLKRRDFTVNAIAAKILVEDNKLNYKLFDPYFGKNDIKARKLKALHNKSYVDDPTRILRGIDFNLRFDLDFTDEDKQLINSYLRAPDREGLSIDRVKLTLKKLFSDARRGKEAYRWILEKKIYRIWQNEIDFKTHWDERLCESISIFSIKKPYNIYLGAIFDNKKYKECFSVKNNEDLNFEIFNFFKDFSSYDLAIYFAIHNDKNAVYYYKKLRNIKIKTTGDDIITLGFRQGKIIGKILRELLRQKINHPESLKNKEEEKSFILSRFVP